MSRDGGRAMVWGVRWMGLVVLGLTGVQALAQPGPAYIADIIVSGEKREVPLQQTATSTSVLTHSEIEALGLTDARDIYANAVNVSETFGGSGFSIRGISNIGVTGDGGAATASIYVDGVPLDFTYLHGAPTQLWDVAQVEVFRGPQSTLQGLNALAGAVVVHTTDPMLDRWEAKGRFLASDEWKFNFAAAGGGPVFRDELAIRLAFENEVSDGFIRNQTRNTGEDKESKSTLRFKTLWMPQSVSGLSVSFGYTHFSRNGGFFNVFARTDHADFFDRRFTTDDTPNSTDVRFDGASLELRYDIAGGARLTSATGWSDVSERSTYDSDFGPLNQAYGRQRRDYQTFTHELRLNAETGPLSGLLGLFFYDRDLDSVTVSRTNVPTPVTTIAALLRSAGLPPSAADSIAASYGAALPTFSVDFDGSFPTKIQSIAIFGDGQLRVNPHLKVLAGFRFEHDTDNSGTVQRSMLAGALPNPLAFGSLAPIIAQINGAVVGFVGQANGSLPLVRRRFDTFLPKGGMQIDWNDQLSTAFVVQRGFRSGGSSVNIARGLAFAYAPEHTWNYELAFRSTWLDGRLRLNANAFYTKWLNQQVSVNFGLNVFDTQKVNAGRSHLFGFEVEADGQISDGWSMFASVGHVRTKFETFEIEQTGNVSDLSGTEFAFAPRWTMVAGTKFSIAGGIDGSIDAKHSSRAFGTVGLNQGLSRIPAHTIVNLQFGYTINGWSIHVRVTNVLGEQYIVYKSANQPRSILNEPRTFGMEIRAGF